MTYSSKQKGFTMLPNDVLESVMIGGFTKRELLLLLHIFRYGYGYNHPFSQCERDVNRIAKCTGLGPTHINATIRALVAKKVIKIEQGNILFIWHTELEDDVEQAGEKMRLNQSQKKTNTAFGYDRNGLKQSRNSLNDSDMPPSKENIHKKETPISPIREPLEEPHQSKQAIDEIIATLNRTTGKSFRPSSKQTQRFIRARLAEGFKIEDFEKVIKVKTEEWKGDAKMDRYLRPETLFANKFEGYLQEENRTTKTQTAFGFGDDGNDNDGNGNGNGNGMRGYGL
jgi:phage replication O-like protein O